LCLFRWLHQAYQLVLRHIFLAWQGRVHHAGQTPLQVKELVCHFLNTWPCLPFGGRELLKIDISLMLKELGRDCGSCVPV
jgi:hypothetical protein